MKKHPAPTLKRFLFPTIIILVISVVLTYPMFSLITTLLDPFFDHPQLGPKLCADIQKGGEGLCLLGFFIPAFFLSAMLASLLTSASALIYRSWKQYTKTALLIGTTSTVALLATTLPYLHVKQIVSLSKEVSFIKTSDTHAQNLVERYKNELEKTGSLDGNFGHYKWLLEKSGSSEALGDLYIILAENMDKRTRESAYQWALKHYQEALKNQAADGQGLELKITKINQLLKK